MKMKIAAVFYLLFLFSSSAYAALEPSIRVAVLSGKTVVTIEAEEGGLLEVTDLNKRNIIKTHAATVSSAPYGVRVNGRQYSSGQIMITGKITNYKIEDRKFSGTLRIFQKNGKLTVINDLPLETYIAGIINSEISSSWPSEAIKAQAVAARTYAMNQIEKTRRAHPDSQYDIESTMMDQVYAGAHREDPRSQDLAGATRGQVLTRYGAVFPAFYHSCCGGRTEQAENVWEDAEGPPPVDDRFCERSPKRNWTLKISKTELQNILKKNGVDAGTINAVTTVPLFGSPRTDTVIFETTAGIHGVKATQLRKMLGYSEMKSTWFEAAVQGSNIIFNGRGYGHGVGMCQWGAKGMAEQGYEYTDILKFYYPDAKILTLY
jgi:stage II sporulation protein D